MQPGTPPPTNVNGDHLLIPVGTQPAYAAIRANGNGVSKVRFGSLK